jgi:hypothetical protein
VSADWLNPVAAALDGAGGPVPFFFRDDDAGWDEDALWALLDVFAAAGVPVDVAAIPAAVGPACGRELAGRAAAGLVRVHQHGRTHVNHEPAGRACEFGPSRFPRRQALDVIEGREMLEDRLGRAVEPVFTPPWNRCTPATADAALAGGHTVLSRDVSAGRLDVPGLAEVPISVDWSARRKGVALPPGARGAAIAERLAAGAPVGVMLHHAVLDAAERQEVRRLLDLVAGSANARPTTILVLAGGHLGADPADPPSGRRA